MHILVAEDDRDIASLIAHYMQKSGWQAHIAGSGDDALAYALVISLSASADSLREKQERRLVSRLGIEPRTRRLRVCCSAN